MALTKRQAKKRKVDMCINAQNKSAAYLLEIRPDYDPDYLDYLQTIDSILEVHARLVDLLTQLREVI